MCVPPTGGAQEAKLGISHCRGDKFECKVRFTGAPKRVVGTRTTKNDAPADLCGIIKKIPLQLSLVDDFSVWRQLEEEAWSKVQPFLWSALAVLWVGVVGMVVRELKPSMPKASMRSEPTLP